MKFINSFRELIITYSVSILWTEPFSDSRLWKYRNLHKKLYQTFNRHHSFIEEVTVCLIHYFTYSSSNSSLRSAELTRANRIFGFEKNDVRNGLLVECYKLRTRIIFISEYACMRIEVRSNVLHIFYLHQKVLFSSFYDADWFWWRTNLIAALCLCVRYQRGNFSNVLYQFQWNLVLVYNIVP